MSTMKKIKFLNDLAKYVWGPQAKVEGTDCGQCYTVTVTEDGLVRMMYVDSLKGGRCSIKIKYYADSALGHHTAARISRSMMNYLLQSDLTVDAATKAGAYRGHNSRFGYYYVANLKCDRFWE